MRTNLIALALLSLSGTALASDVEIKINLPWAEPPPLVVVSPGIQIVPDYDEEIFFVSGFYWVRRDGKWWKARDHRASWVLVPSGVPASLVKLTPGRYRNFKVKAKAVASPVPAAVKVKVKGGGHGKGKLK